MAGYLNFCFEPKFRIKVIYQNWVFDFLKMSMVMNPKNGFDNCQGAILAPKVPSNTGLDPGYIRV
jgi:hypothetical protein